MAEYIWVQFVTNLLSFLLSFSISKFGAIRSSKLNFKLQLTSQAIIELLCMIAYRYVWQSHLPQRFLFIICIRFIYVIAHIMMLRLNRTYLVLKCSFNVCINTFWVFGKLYQIQWYSYLRLPHVSHLTVHRNRFTWL